jgi:hypothetical protein
MIELDDDPRPRKPRRLRESQVEAYLVRKVEENGGVAEKFTSPNRRSVPDRIVMWPYDDGFFGFVECKAPGEKPTPSQEKDHERRRKMGFSVEIVDSYEAVDAYLKRLGLP